jgi:hypothetical protein
MTVMIEIAYIDVELDYNAIYLLLYYIIYNYI